MDFELHLENGTAKYEFKGALEVPNGLEFDNVGQAAINTVKQLYAIFENGIQYWDEASSDLTDNYNKIYAADNIGRGIESLVEAYDDFETLKDNLEYAYEKAADYGGLKVSCDLVPNSFVVKEVSSNYLDDKKPGKAEIPAGDCRDFVDYMSHEDFRQFLSELSEMYKSISGAFEDAFNEEDSASDDSDGFEI